MKNYGKPRIAFQAPDNCIECGGATNHSIVVRTQDDETVHHSRNCKSCGRVASYFTSTRKFVLLAAAAGTGYCILFGLNPLNFFL